MAVTATPTEARPKSSTTTAVVKSTLRSDGTWKHTLPARDLRRMDELSATLRALMHVPNLEEKAKAVLHPLVELREELGT